MYLPRFVDTFHFWLQSENSNGHFHTTLAKLVRYLWQHTEASNKRHRVDWYLRQIYIFKSDP